MGILGSLLALWLLCPSFAAASEPPPEAILADLPFAPDAPNRVIIDLAPED